MYLKVNEMWVSFQQICTASVTGKLLAKNNSRIGKCLI